jgi:hypothetical protein
MPRPPTYTPALRAKIRKMGSNKTIQQIRAALKQAGDPVPAVSTVQSILKGSAPKASKSVSKRAPAAPRRQETPTDAAQSEESREVSRVVLREHLRQSRELLAESREDPAELVALGTSIRHDVQALMRLDPEPPPVVEDPPDMIEAADNGLKKLLEYVERG